MKNSFYPVSIIIPVFNRPAFVTDAIESALAQSYNGVEVVVVDDGSTDDTPHVLRKYTDRIKIVTQPNRGQSAARNRGLVECSGEYILFLDSDDYLEPFAIESLFTALKRKEKETLDWGLSYGKRLTCNEKLVPLKTRRKHYYSGDVLPQLLFDNFVRTGTYLVRKSILETVGGFKEDLVVCEDLLLLYAVATRTKFHFINQFLVRYRRHGGPRARENLRQRLIQGTRHLDYFFAEVPSPVPAAIMMARSTLYGKLHVDLFKVAWQKRLWNQAALHFRAACIYRKRYFFYPKFLIRASLSAMRLSKKDGSLSGQTSF